MAPAPGPSLVNTPRSVRALGSAMRLGTTGGGGAGAFVTRGGGWGGRLPFSNKGRRTVSCRVSSRRLASGCGLCPSLPVSPSPPGVAGSGRLLSATTAPGGLAAPVLLQLLHALQAPHRSHRTTPAMTAARPSRSGTRLRPSVDLFAGAITANPKGDIQRDRLRHRLIRGHRPDRQRLDEQDRRARLDGVDEGAQPFRLPLQAHLHVDGGKVSLPLRGCNVGAAQ